MAILSWAFSLLAATQLVSATGATYSGVKRYEEKLDDNLPNCTVVQQRRSWQNFTLEERAAYIEADLCLMDLPPVLGIEGAQNRWDELMWVHVVQASTVHEVGAFLPFHRYLMFAHEYVQRTECNYTGPAQPWWDEVNDVDDFFNSEVFWTENGFGGGGDEETGCINDGPFAGLELHFNDDKGIETYCAWRNFSNQTFQGAAQSNIDECQSKETYEDAWNCFKGQVHGAGHGGVGGVMLNTVTSPGDPIFYLHHTDLDRLWWQWQEMNLSTRLTDMSGRNVPDEMNLAAANWSYPGTEYTDYFGDGGGNVTTLNHTLWMVGIMANRTIGEVMDTRNGFLCYEYV